MMEKLAWLEPAFQKATSESQPQWLSDLRQTMFDDFTQQGLPTKKHEDWKYTSLKEIEKIVSYDSSNTAVDIPRMDYAEHNIVVINGIVQQQSLPCGVSLENLFGEKLGDDDFVKSCLQSGELRKSPIAKLNLALATHGFVVKVDKSVVINDPIHLYFITTDATISNVKTLFVVSDNANVGFVHEYHGRLAKPYFNNYVTDWYVASSANVRNYQIIREAEVATHVGYTYVQQDRDSHFANTVLAMSGKVIREDLEVNLQHRGAHCQLNGLSALQGQQHADHHTAIVHQADNTTSSELYKGILNDKATTVFNGKVIVPHGVKQINSEQANHNLLLSKTAEVNTKPELEIYSDDVKCAHGATTGQLDQEQIFYLMSRGLSQAQAMSVLTHAFAMDIIDDIPCEQLKDKLKEVIHGYVR